jgi:hypothetical protein
MITQNLSNWKLKANCHYGLWRIDLPSIVKCTPVYKPEILIHTGHCLKWHDLIKLFATKNGMMHIY